MFMVLTFCEVLQGLGCSWYLGGSASNNDNEFMKKIAKINLVCVKIDKVLEVGSQRASHPCCNVKRTVPLHVLSCQQTPKI